MSRPTTVNRVGDDPVPLAGARGRPPAPDATDVQADRRLLDAIERIGRAQSGRSAGWQLLVLHLSNIPPPGPRPHHQRVAAAVLDDAATRGQGQLFALASGDMALLFRPADAGAAVLAILARLFKADMPDDTRLRTLWPLPDAQDQAVEWARRQGTGADRSPPRLAAPAMAGTIAAMDVVVQTSALSDLMHRQTAVVLRPGRPMVVVPLFRELAISISVLEARIAGGSATADPYLFSHLAARLDHRMLGALRQDVSSGGLLSMGLGDAALHVNMTVAGILSTGFASFASTCRDALASGLQIGVEVPFVEAFSDIKAFILARERLRLAGLHIVLDGLTHHALALTRPAALQATLVKLNWVAALPGLGETLRPAIEALGAEHLVLHHVDSEAGVAWGLGQGITRFQGRYVDMLLAAQRLKSCPHAAACILRQCTERASATGPAGRAGCGNHTLLDRAAPSITPGTAAAPAQAAA